MLNGVNNVGYDYSLKSKQSFQRKVDNPINPEQKKSEEKHSHAGLKLAGAVLTAAAIVAGLVVGNKSGALKNLSEKIPQALEKSKLLKFAKEPAGKVLSSLNQAGGWLSTKGSSMLAKGQEAFKTVKGFAKEYGGAVADGIKDAAKTAGTFLTKTGKAIGDFVHKIFVK